MSPARRHFPDEFYRDADLRLVQAIPPTALDLLDTESESDALAEVLRHLIPERRVYGLGNASVGAFSACFADAKDAALVETASLHLTVPPVMTGALTELVIAATRPAP
mgnify:CR=1 FL=1